MARRVRAWLRRKLKLSSKTPPRALGGSNPHAATPSTQKDFLPPPYATLDPPPLSTHGLPSSIDGSESLEVLRTRNPATRPPPGNHPILRPPQHVDSSVQATYFAACTAGIGMIRALDESDPRMVAARTAQAIAVAVSTSRSYAAFVAAVTAVESSALLLVEGLRDNSQSDRIEFRQLNALNAATNAAMAADAGILPPIRAWPSNIRDTHHPEFSPRTASHSADWISWLTNLVAPAAPSQS